MPVQNARKILTQSLQRLGYALLLPVSILPLAALLHRLGQPDVLDLAVLSLAGRALFSQMPLIYAVAIAFGLSRQGQGAQALAGAVNFLLLSSALGTLVPGLHADMICGLLAGLVTAMVCSRARALRLPGWLRPLQEDLPGMLLSALACLLLVLPLSILWPLLEQGLTLLASDLLTTPFGAFCYGVLNRLLIPLGLHQVLGSLIGLGRATCKPSRPPSRCMKAMWPGSIRSSCSACPVPVLPSGSIASGCSNCPREGCCSPWRSPRHWWASRSPSSSCLPSPPPGCFWPMPC
jgi:phosphotransferase system  glucose/maltose/N-acetylglucosamine-specific IIC component